MKKKTATYLYQIMILLLLPVVSCNKLVDVGQPIDALNSDKVFTNEGTALSALNGLYIQWMSSGLTIGNSLITITAGLSADELTLGTNTNVFNEFLTNNISVGNTYTTSLWSNAYGRIYQCNAILGNTQKSTGLSIDLKNRLNGEAKLSRAFFYFYLIQLYGDVPLVLSTDYTQTASIPRTPAIAVYQQVVADLKDAQLLLTTDLSNGKTQPTKWAAEALLARVYLYQKNWKDAAAISGDVIASSQFQIVSDLSQVFLANSDEAVWQLSPTDGTAYTWEGSYFIPRSTSVPSYSLQNSLVASFENGDARKANWTGTTTVNGTTYTYPYKYRVGSGTGSATEYYMVLRYAEQFLIHAEASANNGDLASALKDLDKLRSRAGLVPYTNDGQQHNQANILQLIEKERQHELFCEWGHRWFDLNRTARALAVLGPLKPAFKQTATLFPIPLTQIQRNPQLVQNPGY